MSCMPRRKNNKIRSNLKITSVFEPALQISWPNEIFVFFKWSFLITYPCANERLAITVTDGSPDNRSEAGTCDELHEIFHFLFFCVLLFECLA